MTNTLTPKQIEFAAFLEANHEALEVCRRYCAWTDADAMRDDPDMEALYEMFYNGIGAAKNMSPNEVAESLLDEDIQDAPFDALVKEFQEAMG